MTTETPRSAQDIADVRHTWNATDCTCGEGNEQDGHHFSCAKWIAVLPPPAPDLAAPFSADNAHTDGAS